ncbi:MAG: DUF1003 domain-containing protein [Hyphomicrobiaceae bacterium]
MDKEVSILAQRLLNTGFEEMPERERRVIQRVARRLQVSRNINREYIDNRTFGQRLSDRVAEFGGSWTFIIVFTTFMLFWALLNSTVLVSKPIDPFPFIFLNLILSMVAALQAPVIMMSQNRQAARDRLAAASDYEINLKAELEIMALHEKVDHMRVEQLEFLVATQQKQIDLLTKLAQGTGRL